MKQCGTFCMLDVVVSAIGKLIKGNVERSVKGIILSAYLFFVYLVLIAAAIILPLHIILDLGIGQSISIFKYNLEELKYNFDNNSLSYIVFFVIIIVLKIVAVYFSKSESTDYDILIDYFESNTSDLSNSGIDIMAFFTIILGYIFMFYILSNVIYLYKTSKTKESKDEATNTISEKRNIFADFYSNIFGKLFNTAEYVSANSNIYMELSGVFFALFIAIIILSIILFIIYAAGNNINAFYLIFYHLFVPIISLALIIFITLSCTEFNKKANQYILDEPNLLYKKHIYAINTEFNKILDEEYKNIDDTKKEFVCRNIGNAIINMLYAKTFIDIFEDPLYENYVTPDFIYDSSCDNVKSFNFANKLNDFDENKYKNKDKKEDKDKKEEKHPEYDIRKYINAKNLNKSIFYNLDNCSEINSSVVTNVIKNILSTYTGGVCTPFGLYTTHFDTLVFDESINENKYQKIERLKNHIAKKNIKVFNDFQTEIKNKLNISANNVANIKVYYNTETPLTQNSKEAVYNNNKLELNIISSLDKTSNDFSTVIDNVVKIYMNMIYEVIYIYYNNNGLTQYDDYFVNQLTNIIFKCFDDINEVLSSPIQKLNNDILTKYIITNYNNLVDKDEKEKIYHKYIFDRIDTSKVKVTTQQKIEQDLVKNNINTFYSYLQQAQTNYESVYNLYDNVVKYNKSYYETNYQPLYDNLINNSNIFVSNTEIIGSNVNTNIILNGQSGSTYDFVKNQIIDKNIQSTSNIKNYYEYLMPKEKPKEEQKTKEQNVYKDREVIESNRGTIKKSLSIVNNSYKAYLNKQEATIRTYSEDLTSLSITDDMQANIKGTNSLIYILLVSYIVIIIVIIFLEKIINLSKNLFLKKLPINAKYYSEKAYQSVKEFFSSNK
jgi:hypothetical protein